MGKFFRFGQEKFTGTRGFFTVGRFKKKDGKIIVVGKGGGTSEPEFFSKITPIQSRTITKKQEKAELKERAERRAAFRKRMDALGAIDSKGRLRGGL